MSTKNEDLIRAFAESFDPALAYVRTERINGVKVPDAWTCSHWIKALGLGVMAVAVNGQIRSYIESAGKGEEAARIHGQAIADVFDRLKASGLNGADHGT